MVVTKLHLDEEVARLPPLRQAQLTIMAGEISPMVGDEDDPRAPYKVYEDDKPRGTYKTRAEARRRQQQLESEQSNRPEPHPHFSIKDRHGRVAM
jgi:hypothetical protein